MIWRLHGRVEGNPHWPEPIGIVLICSMEKAADEDAFFDTLPIFAKFEGVADAGNYRPLPDSWALATADIVGSTKAIEAGRYKSVNTAGASVISALLNTLARRDLPFVFGGDGALVAFPGSAREEARGSSSLGGG
jgi:hypothetical protein